jgi:hypothetical protein
MTAEIAEALVLDVTRRDCGTTEGPFTSRSEAEAAADDHDARWHTPLSDDVPVEVTE